MLVHDAVLIDGSARRERGWVRTSGVTIAEVGADDAWQASVVPGEQVVDAVGAVLTPGFIDLHSHGGAGVAFSAEDPAEALAFHRSHGTTRTLLSLVSAPIDRQCGWLERIAATAADDPLVLGSHLEGPYLATHRCGAHDPAVLVAPDAESVELQLSAAGGTLAMVTIAPELPGADDAIARFVDAGAVVAVGHTDADYDTARRAFDAGATVLTHAFNAMPAMLHRAPGPVMAAVDARAVLELILDGVHVHPSVAAGLFRLAPGRVALITDAISAAGCVDGTYPLGSLTLEVYDGRATLVGSDTLAGSVLTQDAALRRAVDVLGVDPVDAVRALTAVPAAALGRDDLGWLRPGCRADLVLLDDEWSPTLVVGDGAILHER
ncbi:MAG: N-acetylglucosamine-6-phosphate deacetylase [Microthrixaceae bacterium]